MHACMDVGTCVCACMCLRVCVCMLYRADLEQNIRFLRGRRLVARVNPRMQRVKCGGNPPECMGVCMYGCMGV